MASPHSWSRRQVLATSGLSLLLTLKQSSAESSAPSLTWSNLYGGDQTLLKDIAPAHTDGWVAVGVDTKKYNALIVSVATDGTARWQKIRTDSPPEHADSIVQRDEGYAVAGGANGDDDQNEGPYLTLVDIQGSVETTTIVDTIGDLRKIEFVQTDQGGYVLAGNEIYPSKNVTTVCGFDSDGRHQWTRRYEDDYWFQFMLAGSESSIIVGGDVDDEGNLWLAEFTVDDGERRKTTIPTTGWFDGNTAARGPEGGLLIRGSRSSSEEEILIRLTSEREIDWVRQFEFGTHAFQRVENGYLLASVLDSDHGDSLRLTRVDAAWNTLWQQVYDVETTVRGLLIQEAGNVLLAGSTEAESETAWMAKISDSPVQPAPTENTSMVHNSTAALHGQNTSNSSESTTDLTPGIGLGTAATGLAAVLWGQYYRNRE